MANYGTVDLWEKLQAASSVPVAPVRTFYGLRYIYPGFGGVGFASPIKAPPPKPVNSMLSSGADRFGRVMFNAIEYAHAKASGLKKISVFNAPVSVGGTDKGNGSWFVHPDSDLFASSVSWGDYSAKSDARHGVKTAGADAGLLGNLVLAGIGGMAIGAFAPALIGSGTATTATGASSFSADVAASQAATAASLSTAPASSMTLIGSISPAAGATASTLAASSLTDAGIAAGLSGAGVSAATTAAASQALSLLDKSTIGGTSSAGSVLPTTGASKMSIFSDLGGAVKDIGGGLVDAYGAVLDTQVKKAQLDALAAQSRAAAQPTIFQGAASGISMQTIAIGLVALFGVVMLVRR